jgi:hypothetical protein
MKFINYFTNITIRSRIYLNITLNIDYQIMKHGTAFAKHESYL